MFGEPCGRYSDESAAATAAVSLYVRGIVERSFPDADGEALATAIWGLVHGLAFLRLDGELDASSGAVMPERDHCRDPWAAHGHATCREHTLSGKIEVSGWR
jgi:hypothetical protein